MAIGTDKILGPKGAGMLDDDDKLTKACRAKLVADVIAIMMNGNDNGMGLLHTLPPLPLPVYPIPGPKIILNPILKPEGENLLWFEKEPLAPALIPILLKKDGEFQKLFVDGLFAPLVKMLNLAGSTNLGPIIDPTIVVDMSKFPNLTMPDLPGLMADIFIQVVLSAPPSPPPVIAVAKLKLFDDFGIGDPKVLDLIALAVPPKVPDLTPPSFSIPIPPLPIPIAGISTPNFPDLALGIFKIPLELIGQLMSLITAPSFDPLELILKIIKLIVEIILALLKAMGIVGLPKLLLSFLMVVIKDLAIMLLCVVIGKLLGTGLLVKIVGGLGGLV
jgi:hypothetical protein